MNHEQCACKQLKVVVFGQRPDQTDGLLSIGMNNAQTLHGTKEHPGGLVQQVQDIEELVISKAEGAKMEAIAEAKRVEASADKRLKALEDKMAFHNKIIWVAIGIGIAARILWEIYKNFGK